MTTTRTEEDLIAIARKYYGDGRRLIADVDTGIVRPYGLMPQRGMTAVRIDDAGRWEEGWLTADDFRPLV